MRKTRGCRIDLLPLALLLLVQVGCNRHDPELRAATKPSVQALGQAVGAPEVKALVQGNNQFAFDLYGRLHKESGNLCFSPYSLSAALAQTYAGAKNQTAKQMVDVLHFNLSQEQLHPAFADLERWLVAERKGITLRIANRLWGQTGYEFLPDYLRITREQYGAELGQVDFVQNPEAARQAINAWVEPQTNAKIQNFIPAGVLHEQTRLAVTNAIYFQGSWASQFDPRLTKDAPFHVAADEQVVAPFMFQRAEFQHAAVAGAQILELPYVGQDLAMVILLPSEAEGLASLEEQLTADNLSQWLSELHKQKVNVWLPRFKLASQFGLGDVLAAMGLVDAFAPDQADFSGMTGRPELCIGAVIHKAYVDVNEEGTEAAAATAVTNVKSITPTFRADHPFVFLIRDRRTGSILFMGRVVNPQSS